MSLNKGSGPRLSQTGLVPAPTYQAEEDFVAKFLEKNLVFFNIPPMVESESLCYGDNLDPAPRSKPSENSIRLVHCL